MGIRKISQSGCAQNFFLDFWRSVIYYCYNMNLTHAQAANRNKYFREAYNTSWKRRFQAMVGRAKTAAKHSTSPLRVSITAGDLQQQFDRQGGRDYYTGRPLELATGLDPLRSPSLDRLDSKRGFIPTNIVITTYAINRAKSTLAFDEFISMCHEVVQQHVGKVQVEAKPVVEEPEAPVVAEEPKIDVYSSPNAMSNLMQRQLEEMNIAPLTGLRDLSWKEGRE